MDAFLTPAFYPTATQRTIITYVYDPLYRLTQADAPPSASLRGQAGALTYTFEYDYDAVGNRTTQTATITSTQVTAYQYDAANRLTSVNGQAYTWDDNGNLVDDGGKAYTYDQAKRLKSISGSGVAVTYAYNGEGARLIQIVNGTPTTYTLDLATPLVQVLMAKDSTSNARYLYGITRIGEQQSGGWLYHLTDALGSVRQLADSSGSVQLARGYMPYGEPVWLNGTASSRYAFTGEDYDPTVGLVFLWARYMNPTLGIFLARDPWSGDVLRPESMNGFVYGEGKPVNQTDPSGWSSSDPGNSCDDDCQLVTTLGVEYEPFVYNTSRLGQVAHIRWIVKDHTKCSVVQFVSAWRRLERTRDGKRIGYQGHFFDVDDVWDRTFTWSTTGGVLIFTPELETERIEMTDPPGFGNGNDRMKDGWYELWFNASSYLYNKIPNIGPQSTMDEVRQAVWSSSPLQNSVVRWGFKFGAYIESGNTPSEGGPGVHLEFYTEGPPGLPFMIW